MSGVVFLLRRPWSAKQCGERFDQVGLGLLVAIDEDLLEENLVEELLDVVGCVLIGPMAASFRLELISRRRGR